MDSKNVFRKIIRLKPEQIEETLKSMDINLDSSSVEELGLLNAQYLKKNKVSTIIAALVFAAYFIFDNVVVHTRQTSLIAALSMLALLVFLLYSSFGLRKIKSEIIAIIEQ